MSTLLLIIIYITFIGLGIPDSLFGTAWPAVYAELELPISWANFITLTISGGTIVSSLLSTRLVNRFGTARVTAVSTVMTAAALLGFSLSGNFFSLWLMAIPLGLGAGAIDTVLNNYVALHYKAAHMNFLHCFYGIGVSLSPFLMSAALAQNADWRGGYRTVFMLQAAIAVLSVVTLPVWKKAGAAQTQTEETSRSAGILPILKSPKLYFIGMIFIGSCAVECTCGGWGSTFLVEARGASVDAAARVITLYYVGIAAGRFISGLLAERLTCRQLVGIGQVITAAAILLLLLPLPSVLAAASLFLIGFGNSTVFPNMLQMTPLLWGRELSQAAMGLQMALAYVGILSAPALFGLLAQRIGLTLFPYYLAVFFAVMLAGVILTRHYTKKHG